MMRHVPVLIVGGGPVGLALAGELGFQGVACELVEQGDGEVRTPKLTEVNIRTMELCRRWGIAERVHACPFPGTYPLDVVFLHDLGSEEILRIERPARELAPPQAHSPMAFQACSQMWFDPVLRAHACSHEAVRVRSHVRLQSFRDHGDHVVAVLADRASGTVEQVACEYLVGCDGAASSVRTRLGIALNGAVLGHTLHLHFRAARLLESSALKPATFFHFLDAEGLWATMRVIDPRAGLWRIMVLHLDGPERPDTVDRARLLRRVLGRDLDVQWIDSYVWARRSMVADAYGTGRVFLAGDAAHQFSPTGALGMNTGIADAVDLGWKLAAVLRGWGGPRLLPAYEAERRPVAVRNADATADFYLEYTKFAGAWDCVVDARGNERQRRRASLADQLLETVGRNFRTLGLQLGYRYAASTICLDDEPHAEMLGNALDPHTYAPSARPGARAPHKWLPDGRSTLDLFSRDFVLLRRGRQAPDGSSLQAAARRRGIPLSLQTIDETSAGGEYPALLTLVRPDGHVAWRGQALPSHPDGILDIVTGAAVMSA